MQASREKILRRAITVPGFLLAFVLGIVALPFLVPLTLVIDLSGRRRFGVTRTLVFVVYYLGCETMGILVSFWLWLAFLGRGHEGEDWLAAHYRLQAAWASAILAGVRKIFSLAVAVEGLEKVARGCPPFLLFVRHVSIGDTVLAAVYLAAHQGHRLRYVLKRELLWDPCLDIVGHRIPNHFVVRSGDSTEREIEKIRALARDLGPGEGVLIYPEGTRFTPARREAILRRLEQRGDPEAVDRAKALRCVLPPRLGGAGALLEEAAEADVVFCAHVGFEGTMRLTDLVSGTLVGTRVLVRFSREAAGSIPRDRSARVDWLFAQWAEIDRWVAANGPMGAASG